MAMETFKVTENYGSSCNECGRTLPGKASTVLTINGVIYTLCEDCFRRFIGELYNQKTPVFEELISLLGKKDRSHMLKLINS
jgi:ribosome-binding protein aMBF1 (putative translation factor)